MGVEPYLEAIEIAVGEVADALKRYEGVQEIRIVDEYYAKNNEKVVNALLQEGWKLLSITQSGVSHEGISTYYTLGRYETTKKEMIKSDT